MAAILALVFIFALASMLLMVGIVPGQLSIATGAAAVIFMALAAGVVLGLLRMMRHWDAGDEHEA